MSSVALSPDSEDFLLPADLPLLPIRDLVVFPFMIVPLVATRDVSALALEAAYEGTAERLVFLATQRNADEEAPTQDGLHVVGCVATIMRMSRGRDGRMKVLVQGLARARVGRITQSEPFFRVAPTALSEPLRPTMSEPELEALVRAVKESVDRCAALGKNLPEEVTLLLQSTQAPGRIADIIAGHLALKVHDAMALFDAPDDAARLLLVHGHLDRELEMLTLQQHIQDQARQEMTKTQREYFLREQMRAIRVELGDDDARSEELDELRVRAESAQMPEVPRKEAMRQLKRLGAMNGESSEAAVLRNYVDWLVDLPWGTQTDDELDLKAARDILDADHFGLEKIKERILEHLAVCKLKQDMRGPILCFVGPPGVGKTSLGRSIARAMGRKFAQASLGGLRDEAEIRGHRRTYVGAMPGRIIQGLKQAGSRNPVFMLDELDKLGADVRGDPSSALLEVLDPAQNNRFVDLYLNVPFDLSNVMFIATANVVDAIPGPLRDRMELIGLSGYTEEEKLEIARRHIVPRALADHGLAGLDVKLPMPTLRRIVSDYTREAGLRNLDRQVSAVCRKLARRFAEGREGGISVTPARLPELLGPPRPPEHARSDRDEVGVVTGLAWTQAGGDVLQIEATPMPGTGALKLTGQLGEVMKESAHAAMTWVRSNAGALGIPETFFKEHELHVHVPAGAIPKDGPSAGVTLTTALASIATGRPVRRDVAMTGEVTLRGHVLAVGGIREKVLAAARAGMKTVLLPASNVHDLDELHPSVRRKLRIVLVRQVEEVLREALGDGDA